MSTQKATAGRHAKRHQPFRLLVVIILIGSGESLWSRQVTNIRPPGPSPAKLEQEIVNAGSDQFFALELRFHQAVTVADLRSFASQFRVPRILAYVDHWYGNQGPEALGLLMIGLGNMYSSNDARLHTECKALASVGLTEQDDLRGIPVDEWWVHTIHIYATTHTIRMLLNGETLPKADIMSGGIANTKQLSILEDYTNRKISKPIQFERIGKIPDYCSRFFAPLDAPILTGGFPHDFQRPQILEGEDFRTYAFRVLGQLPVDTSVTIQLKLDHPTNVEALASLVREYDIRGMNAEMVPEHSNKQLIAQAILSTFNPNLNDQIHRTRCQMGLGGEEPQASSEWYADWIRVSVSTENAVLFMSYPGISRARITGFFAKNELDRLKDYYRRQKDQVFSMPPSMFIPTGCDDVYIHDKNMQTGSTRPFVGPPE